MRESTVKQARENLDKAIQRLLLDDIDEQDVEKALASIEDAKNILNK